MFNLRLKIITLPLLFIHSVVSRLGAFEYGTQMQNSDEDLLIPEVIRRDENFIRLQTSMPTRIKDKPLILKTGIAIESVSEIQNNFAVFEIHLSEKWKDPMFNDGEPISMSGPGINYFDWIPDTYFLLSKKTKYFSNTQSIRFDGQNVTLDRKIRITGSCTTHVWFFPFDDMRCKIIYSSYGFGDTEMILQWSSDAIRFPFSHQLTKELGFNIAKISKTEYAAEYNSINYCILEGSIYLKRIWSIYLIQSYLPATFLVILSTTTFWLNEQISGLPARASVGITSVLAMLTICRRRSSPKDNVSRNFSLMDTYLWVSFIFVSINMLFFALGDFLRTDEGKPEKKITNKNVDKSMRVLFPSCFTIFVLLYWYYVYTFILNVKLN